MEIALVTYPKLPDLNPDDHPLRDALRARGARVRAVSWDATAVDWAPSTRSCCALEAGSLALSRVPGPWLYARVDGVERSERFLVMEFEVFEPQLFLEFSPAAARRLAEAIIERT